MKEIKAMGFLSNYKKIKCFLSSSLFFNIIRFVEQEVGPNESLTQWWWDSTSN